MKSFGNSKSARSARKIGVGGLNLSDKAKRLVRRVLDSNRLSYGPVTSEFETRFAGRHGSRFGIMSNSGTSALQIALQTLKEVHGWADGDEVIVPAVTFVATVNIVLHNRMKPVLVDIEPTYYEINPGLIEKKLTSRTRAIIPVHLFGQPSDMAPIIDIAKRHNLKIIEDSCETMFASYQGKPVGSMGEIGCFSTYTAHLLVTGVGGMNTTSNPDYALTLRSLISHGRDAIYTNIDDDRNKSGKELRDLVERRFRFVSVGHSFRSTEMEAAIGLAQLDDADWIVQTRRANASRLTEKLQDLEDRIVLPRVRKGNDHSFMMYPVVLVDKPKDDLVVYLEENGVETRDMLPLTNQPVYRTLMDWKEDDYPEAKRINQNGFYVGCHQGVSGKEIDTMADVFHSFFKSRG